MGATSPDPKNRWSVWLVLAAMIFPPLAIISEGPLRGVTNQPWIVVLFIIAYESLLIISGVTQKIWQRLEKSWLDTIAGKIDETVQRLLSQYYKQYQEYFQSEYQDINVKGLKTRARSTKLEYIFIERQMKRTFSGQASTDLLHQVSGTSRKKLYINEEIYTSEKILYDRDHMVILGPPGSGKTTMLQHFGLLLLLHSRRPSKNNKRLPYRLPVLLFLRDHATAIQQQADYSLNDAVRVATNKWQQGKRGKVMPPGWIERYLQKGHCLVLLDGLDEVPDVEARTSVIEWVQSQMLAYQRNRFLITSRAYGYSKNRLDKVIEVEIGPLTPGQVREFLHRWYQAEEILEEKRKNGGGYDHDRVCARADRKAEDLLSRLHQTPRLDVLKVNPLLLTMIATVHNYYDSLPGTRAMLYQQICEVFLDNRQERHRISQNLRAEQRQMVLEVLAYEMMQQKVLEIEQSSAQNIIQKSLERVSNSNIKPALFLQSIEQKSGLLLERENGMYAFAHETFQEYLAMKYIQEQHLESDLVKYIKEGWWHEVIQLYCIQNDASSLVNACLELAETSDVKLTTISEEMLVLALQCSEYVYSMEPVVRNRLSHLLKEGKEAPDAARRRNVARALLKQRLRAMVGGRNESAIDTSFITCAEYQLFVDEAHLKEEAYQPDHWINTHFISGQADAPVTGVRQSDAQAFCTWLMELEAGNWHYRLPEQGEVDLETIRLPEAWDKPIGYWGKENHSFFWIRPQKETQIGKDGISKQSSTFLDFDWHQRLIEGIVSVSSEMVASVNPMSARDLANAHELVHNLARALDHDLANTIALANSRTSNPDFARDLTIANTLARDLALASGLASLISESIHSNMAFHTFASTISNVGILANNLVHVCVSARDLASDLAKSLSNTRNLSGSSDNLVYHLAHVSASAKDLARASLIACDLSRLDVPLQENWLAFARLFALLSISTTRLDQFWSYETHSISTRAWWKRLLLSRYPILSRASDDAQISALILDCVEQLLRRRNREEHSCEGILLVKERVSIVSSTEVAL
jgi:hypothetical protein